MGTNTESQHNKRNSVAEQDTLLLPSVYGRNSILFHKLLGRLPRPIQHLLIALLNRTRDPEPETYDEKCQDAQFAVWGWLPWLAFTSVLGIALIAYAFANSRDGGTGLRTFFYPGLLLIFTPTALRLISPAPSRIERISLLCIAGVYCYLIKVMTSPLYFSYYNEFLHWRTVDDIVRSGHLFSYNVLLPVSAYYPGLEIVTNALSTLSGLDTFNSGLVVIGVARLLVVLVLFGLNEQILKSARMASIATLLYMTNPHFLLYDSQFGYESLALPIFLFIMLAIVYHESMFLHLSKIKSVTPFAKFAKVGTQKQDGDLRWITLTIWIALLALTVIHHMTDFFLDGVLLLWAVFYRFLSLTPIYKSNIAKAALLGVLLSIVWISFNGNPGINYLSSYFTEALNELGHILTSTSKSRPLFVTYTGEPTLPWERLLIALSVLVISLCLPFGLLCLWQRYRSHALICAFSIISLLYPISQLFRFTTLGSNLTDRAAAVLFIPITSVLAVFIAQFWPTRRLNKRQSSLIVCAVTVMFLGGFILGASSGLTSLPGPYALGEPRGIEPEGIQTATWAHSYLGSNNRIGTDLLNQVLMGTYGNQHVVTGAGDHIDVSPIFFASHLGPNELALLRKAHVRYLVVDRRLSQSLPLLGAYFVETEPLAYQRTAPISLEALMKFNTVLQAKRVFDSGDIVIYDVGDLI